jgi:large subunit ribosomal protein L5
MGGASAHARNAGPRSSDRALKETGEATVSKKEDKQKKGKAAKEAPEAAPQEGGKKAAKPKGPQEPPRLKVRYAKEIVPALMKHFSYKNIMAVPKLEKIVINMGLGEAIANAKIMDVAVDELGRISGQRPVVTRAKKSIANFKLRQNMPIGAAVTLRGERMFEFLDRLTSVVLPRVRDFRGVSTKSFDGRGNYTLGLRDQLIFPEISYEKVDKIRGMNVTIVTTARTDDEARELLRQFGMPFRQQ